MWKPTPIACACLVATILISLTLLPQTKDVGAVSTLSTPNPVTRSQAPLLSPGSTLTPALFIAKGVYPHEDVDRNGTVTYTVTLVNGGTTEATDVRITDTLPVSTTFAYWAAQPPGAAADADQITWSGAVTAGEVLTLTFAVTHTGDYADVVTNTVAGQHISKTAAAHATFTVRPAPVPEPALSITKTVEPQMDVEVGGTITYTVALTNRGVDDAEGVMLTDTLPISATFAAWLEQPPGADVDAGQLTWEGTIAAGEGITLSWLAAHSVGRGDVVRNVAAYRYGTETGSAEAAFTVAGIYTMHLPLVMKSWLVLPAYAYGIQAHGEHRLPDIADSVQDLGMTWVKQQVRWAQIEGTQGNYGWAGLDHIVDTYRAAGFEVLLSVTAAPDWARPGKPPDGPPDDYQHFYTFMGVMAEHFEGRVRAYEIWNEPNLKREWNEELISAWNYTRLLRGAYQAIKAADPQAIVVSAGLNPTGLSDNVNAVDDREYLQRLYTAGFEYYCDAIGAHPYGFANPPDVYYTGGDYDPNRGWDDHPSFFFRNTMEDYYLIMLGNGDGHKRVWATEFGWPTVDGMFVLPNPGLEYQRDITEGQQAEYIVRAFEWSRDWGHAGVMLLWNLNYWAAAGPYSEMAKYSLLRADWSPRQAYVAVRDMPK
jgi:uncharacterized repeat protein (TIGR01451 family)